MDRLERARKFLDDRDYEEAYGGEAYTVPGGFEAAMLVEHFADFAESEVRAERARIAAELRKLFGHPTGRCADLRRLTATEVLAFIEELEAK